MRAAVTTDGGGFEVVELPDPSPRPDEVVVKVAACGVCGSDLKARPLMPLGTVMGHELGGEVVAVGAAAHDDGWKEGATVAVLPVVSCGSCSRCAAGHVAHCPSGRFIGMGVVPGGFAELVAVPARHAFRLPDGMAGHHAALVEPLAVGLHGVAAAGIGAGDEVLVIGAGGVGLTAVAWARVRGAERVTAVDPDVGRRDMAISLGAHDAFASIDDVAAAGNSYDAVMECVGRPELVAAGAAAARPRGRIVVLGACERPIEIEPIGALLGELTFRFAVCYQLGEFRAVIDAFADGTIGPAALVGPTRGLDRIDEAFDIVRTTAEQGRTLVVPGAPA